VFVCAAVAAWQFSFNSFVPEQRRVYAMTASMGLCADATNFFYFFYHFGLFPVGAVEVPTLGPSKRDAAEFVARHGDRLKMDFGWPTNTPRFGDYAKLFLFYPDVMLRGDPAQPSLIPFNELLFITSLLALFVAFWREGQTRLGLLIVLLVGSDPFQFVETYLRSNVFSIPISIALLAMAAHVRFLSGRKGVDAPAWAIAIVTGAVLATVREIRAEAALIGLSAIATYLLIRSARLRTRLALVLAFAAAFTITGQLWSAYWSHSFDRAKQFVARAGGQVYPEQPGQHHALWHAIYCGLGDYGADRGFRWDDRAAFRWATTRDPVTNPHPIPYHYDRGYYLAETYDGVHHIAPTDLPEYDRLVRERVVSEIRRDPGWYAGILLQRLIANMGDATPATVSVGALSLAIPGVGWLTIPALMLLIWRRRGFQAKLILFVTPLSALSLLIYSGKGMTYYGIAHLVALAVCIDLALRGVRDARRRAHAH
jgi:hypothetical protein